MQKFVKTDVNSSFWLKWLNRFGWNNSIRYPVVTLQRSFILLTLFNIPAYSFCICNFMVKGDMI